MDRMSRRQFVQWTLGWLAMSALSGCAIPEMPGATPSAQTLGSTPVATLPETTPALTPTPQPARPILQNENRPGFYVRYYKQFEAVRPDDWTLTVEGLIKKTQRLRLADVQSLPRVSQVSRMKCVECWSAPARWEGFHLRSLLELVEPQPEARWLHFYCADTYYESLTLEELLEERVLFAYGMNDAPLADAYGAPLRLVVPFKYGYKGPKAITRLVFADQELRGLWPTLGSYSTDGDILPGTDHPLDLGGARKIAGGEVKYPEGIESTKG